MSTQRDDSRQNWRGSGSVESINSGSLQRIADALEKMSRNYDQLISDRNHFRNQASRLRGELDAERRRSAALRGVITRMKNKAAREAKR